MTTPHATIVFAGGGTGGHLYPALAIADRVGELSSGRLDVDIVLVGTKRGIEYRLRESLGYPLRLINIRGIVRSLTLKNLLLPFVVVGALVKSWLLLSDLVPDVVIGTGGFVSWPVLRVAAFRGIPTMLQEQNSFPGITTRLLASRAKKIYLGFERGGEYIMTSGEKVVTGNPVRHSITDGVRADAIRHFGLDPEKKTILVIGGSQGARSINEAVLRSLDNKNVPDQYQLLWQTGKRDYKDVAERAGSKAERCSLFPFEKQMELVYAATDIAIARAGALTLAELAACGIPSILIPYPHAAGDHQRKNAEDFVARDAAIMIDEDALANTDLISRAVSILESDEHPRMKAAVATMTAGKEPAVDVIAKDIIELIIERKAGSIGN